MRVGGVEDVAGVAGGRLELVDLLDLGSGRGLLLSATVGSAEVGHAAGHTAGGTAGSLVQLHDDGLG